MNYDHKHHMAFLLSLAALPLGGCIITDVDDDDTAGETGTNSNSASATAEGTESTGATDASASVGETGTTTADESGTTAVADETGTTGGEVSQICIDVGAHFEKCGFKDASEIVGQCSDYVDDPTLSAECVTANEEYYVCLTETPCEEFNGKDNPCQAQLEATLEPCSGGTESTGDSGTSSSTGG